MSELAPTRHGDPERQRSAKLVFVGPVGAGKTTAIAAVADSPPVRTDARMSDGATAHKQSTTVALDFAEIALDDETRLLVYSVPGQQRFQHMRAIVLRGAVGVVLLLDATTGTQVADLQEWLAAIEACEPGVPIVVGLTKADLSCDFSMRDIRRAARRGDEAIPVYTIDARDPPTVVQLLRTLVVRATLSSG